LFFPRIPESTQAVFFPAADPVKNPLTGCSAGDD
jgi:hypothetical protein